MSTRSKAQRHERKRNLPHTAVDNAGKERRLDTAEALEFQRERTAPSRSIMD